MARRINRLQINALNQSNNRILTVAGGDLVYEQIGNILVAGTSIAIEANGRISFNGETPSSENANIANTVVSISNFTTSNLTEGTNLYFTNARVLTALETQTVGNIFANAIISYGDIEAYGNIIANGLIIRDIVVSDDVLTGNISAGSISSNTLVLDIITANTYLGLQGGDKILIGANGLITSDAANVTLSATPPENPSIGDTWIDANTGAYLTYFGDGDSAQWAEIATSPIISTGVDLDGYGGNIIPSVTETYSLGSPDRKWKDLHLSGNTIYLGNTTISAAQDSITINNTSIPAGGAFMFRNKIINGNFDIWQRGTSQTSNGYGSADRWRSLNVGTTKTASRQAFDLGQTDVPNNPRYFMRHVVSSVAGASNYASMDQKIEGVETLSGKTVTATFWAKADASKNIAVEFLQYFGSGGSPSTFVIADAQLVALTTSWTKYTITVALPSVSGKTVGSNGDDDVRITFWFDAGSDNNSRAASLGQQSGTFDIAQVQLEEGSAATPFEQRPFGTEFGLCERYYQVVPLNAFNTSTQTYSSPFYMSTPMRKPPTGTISGGTVVSVSSRLLEQVTNKGGRFTLIGSAVGSYSVGASGLMDAEL